MNNYEKIKSMNIDEMAIFLDDGFGCHKCSRYELNLKSCNYIDCSICLRQWLQKECEK